MPSIRRQGSRLLEGYGYESWYVPLRVRSYDSGKMEAKLDGCSVDLEGNKGLKFLGGRMGMDPSLCSKVGANITRGITSTQA